MKKNTNTKKQKSNPLLTAAKAALIALTAVYPLLMVMLSGAGLIYNSNSYGADLVRTGVLFIVSGALMTVGTVLVLCRKNIVSIILSGTGLALCMTMLYKLTAHADSAGWQNNLTLEPISSMYMVRIIPAVAPFVLTLAIALIQFFSYEESRKRLLRRKKREEKENAPAPPIV